MKEPLYLFCGSEGVEGMGKKTAQTEEGTELEEENDSDLVSFMI